jgi:hypothetical protein
MTISCASLPSCSLKTPAAGLDIIADYVSRREGLSASMVVRSGWRALGNSGRGLRPLAEGAPVEGPGNSGVQGPHRRGVTLAPGPSPPDRGGDGPGRTQQETIRGNP